ncbi:MAG: methyl-accepting chemotaxis protein [Reinekea sp.]
MAKWSLLMKFRVLMGTLLIISLTQIFLEFNGVNQEIKRGRELTEREIPILNKAHQVKLAVVEVQQWLTDISATRGMNGLNDGFDVAEESAQHFYRLIDELIQINPENKTAYQAMVPIFEDYYQTGKKMAHAYVDKGPAGGNSMMNEFDATAKKLANTIDNFVAESQLHAEQLEKQQEKQLSQGRTTMTIGFSCILAMLFFIYWMMGRALRLMPDVVSELHLIASGNLTSTRRISHSEDEMGQLSKGLENMRSSLKVVISEVRNASEKVSHAAKSLAGHTERTLQGSDQQLNEISAIASIMTEMSANSLQVSQNTEMVANSARQAQDAAQTGTEVVKTSVHSIEELVANVILVSEAITKLEKDGESIGSILETIGAIAEQTNLLALNAAIESARAGEQGRGFAVVADEVRKLASRTQESTSEIQQTIERLQKGAHDAADIITQGRSMAEHSIEQANQANESLLAISESINQITEMTDQIATAAQQQSQVANDISMNVNRVKEICDTNAQGATETNHAGRQMLDLSVAMNNSASHFSV